MQNMVLNAVAKKLDNQWPGRKVRVDEVPADAAGNYMVRIITPSHKKELGRRRKRAMGVQVVYFTEDHENMEYNSWADTIFYLFEQLELEDGRILHTKNLQAEQVARDYNFTFDVDVRLLEKVQGDTMENLQQTGGIKP